MKYVLALDISTSTIGVTILDTQGKLIEIAYCPLKFPKDIEDPTMDKADYFKEFIGNYKNLPIERIYIEEPLDRSSNAFTVTILAKFNGIISRIVYDMFNVKPRYISVYNWRKLFFPEFVHQKGSKTILSFPKDADKKQLVWEKVNFIEPHIKWEYSKFYKLKKENYDMADSYGVARAGLVIEGYLPNPLTEKGLILQSTDNQ